MSGFRLSRAIWPLVFLFAAWNVSCQDYELGSEGDDDTPTPDDDAADDDTLPCDDDSAEEFCEELSIPGGECGIDEDCVVVEVGTFTPVTLWSKPSWTQFPDYNQVMMAPMVANLTDDNGDGAIDANDVPDVVVVTYLASDGYVRAVSGDDGSEIWTCMDTVAGTSGVAIGDIDGDGLPEIVATTMGLEVIAIEHTGDLKWRSQGLGDRITQYSTNPAISDMDHDGSPEIIAGAAILDAEGVVLGLGQHGTGHNPDGGVGSSSFAVDLDRDGTEEVIAGNAVYAIDGTTLLHIGPQDGFPAVGNFDADPEGEMVVVGGRTVFLFDTDGTELWRRTLGGNYGGPPTVADFDGDGEPEIGVASAGNYAAYDTDGTVMWSRATTDQSSGVTGSSVFDFEGDGVADVVYADEYDLWIFSGLDGAVKLDDSSHRSNTWLEYPVIADVDMDGHAEIVVTHNSGSGPSGTGVSVVEDLDDSWRPARPVWNQHAYFITNVEDDATIPATAATNWDTYNSFRAGNLNTEPGLAVDLVGEFIDVCELECDGERVVIYVQACNQGSSAMDAPFPITIYANRQGQLTWLATTYVDPLVAGTASFGIRFEFEPDEVAGASLVLAVDDDGSGDGEVFECDESNNMALWEDLLCSE